MTRIEEIFALGSADEQIAALQRKVIELPSWAALLKDYEPRFHHIMEDHVNRRDKVRKDGTIEPASRISVGLEKLLTKRMSEFMFAIPVKRVYHNLEGNETRAAIASALERMNKYARIESENIKRANNYFAACEIFTLWYLVEGANSLYGFNSKYKLKCKTFSPMDGTKLYPYFDDYGDMLAISFMYERKTADDETVTIFETFTADRHVKWSNKSGGWRTMLDERITIGKIPGVYAYRPVPIYHGLSGIRHEIEYTLSRNSDVVAYNSAPVLKVAGSISGGEDKGESRRIYRVENGGDVSYVSWSQSIEALKYHVDTLLKLFWTQSQMPDISFDTMKSLGNIGYDARQTLLIDAHLKVGDESGAWLEFLDREINVQKAFLKQLNASWASEVDNVEVENIITPFIQNDEDATIDRLVKANGGKAVMSQLESIQNAGYSADAQATLEQIQAEDSTAQQTRMGNVFGGESAE